jgi:Short C-terminal domain
VFGGKKKKAMNLMENGTKAVGTVTLIRDTGATINDNPRVAMTFRIEPLDGTPAFEAEKTTTVSRVEIPQPGSRYPVWFDPEDHTAFAYATIADATGRQQIVAMFGPEAFGPDGSGVGLPAAAAPAPAADDPIERIKKLSELHAAGVLTDEEFAVKKAELLGEV